MLIVSHVYRSGLKLQAGVHTAELIVHITFMTGKNRR